ncbi:uncharacterized protein LOC105286255 [Ooceraea biroi]|uniref:uncharacterized protein LOC105286255 n=1 Tax=Ooceraea biroi TaxID=2015173 RepID=UPI000F095893|nr:uncharacterized protein LOC105286255 [Ooceraea biroi]
MKLFARPESLTDATAWLTTMNRLVGLRAFEYPRDHPRPVLSLIYFLTLYILYCITLPLQLIYYTNEKLLKLEYVLYQLMAYFMSMSIFLKLTLGWWYTKSFKLWCRKISEIDETLRQLGSTVKYNWEYFMTVGIISAWILFALLTNSMIFIYLLKRTHLSFTIYLVLAYTYGITVNGIIILEFSLLVKSLQNRFRWVNQLLLTMSSSTVINSSCEVQYDEMPSNIEQQKKQTFFKLSQLRQQLQIRNDSATKKKKNSQVQSHTLFELEKKFQEELRNQSPNHGVMKNQKCKHQLQTLKQVHLELCKVSKTLCSIFGVQIACELAMSVMIITGLFYNLYIRFFLRTTTDDLIIQTIPTVIMIFLHVLQFLSLSCSCQRAINEGNKTSEIVHMIYGCNADADIQEETQQFGIQILQCPVKFTAFGMPLDNRILTSCLRSVTTYLVIMIQMSDSLESNNAIQSAKFI